MSFPIYQISVARHGQILTIAQPYLEIPPDAAVQWMVTGVQNDEVVEILVDAENPGELGPFTFTRRSQNVVWARGDSGTGGTFAYKVVLYKLGLNRADIKPVASSTEATLVVEAPHGPERRSGQTVLIEYDAGLNTLLVDQPAIRIVSGDPVIFEFFLPKDLFKATWIPSLYFPGLALAPNRGYGPFSSLSVADGSRASSLGEGLIRRFLICTGASGLVGRFNYQAMVHSIEGGPIVSSPDPVIDNDGEVVCPGC